MRYLHETQNENNPDKPGSFWVSFMSIIKEMNIKEGWPLEAQDKFKAILNALMDDGLLERMDERPLRYRLNSGLAEKTGEEFKEWLEMNISKYPTKRPWKEGSRFKKGSHKETCIPTWLGKEEFDNLKRPFQLTIPEEVQKRKKQPASTTSNDVVNLFRKEMAMDTKEMGKWLEDNVPSIVENKMRDEFADERTALKQELIEEIEGMVEKAADKILEKVAKSGKVAVTHRVQINDDAVTRLKSKPHKKLQECLSIVNAGIPLFLIGLPGTGKTTLAYHIARILKLDFIKQRPDLSPSGPHLNAFSSKKEGGVVLIDEITTGTPETLRELYNLATCEKLHKNRREGYEDLSVIRHAKYMPIFTHSGIFTSSTFGGSVSVPQSSTAQLESEFRRYLSLTDEQRFKIGMVELDFDPAIEATLCPDPELLENLQLWRNNQVRLAKDKRFPVEKIISTDTFRAVYKLKMQGNMTFEDIKSRIFFRYDQNERNIMMAKDGLLGVRY